MEATTDEHKTWQRRAKAVQVCDARVRGFRFRVPSNSTPGVEYTIEGVMRDGSITCSCPGFKFRGTCSHLEITETRCGWDSESSPEAQTLEQKDKGICPRCGGPTESVLRGGF